MVLQAAGKPLARSLVPVRERARGKRDRLQRAGLRRTGSLGWSARKALVLHPTVLPHAAAATDGLEAAMLPRRRRFSIGLRKISGNYRVPAVLCWS
jgi:hypothetical protein